MGILVFSIENCMGPWYKDLEIDSNLNSSKTDLDSGRGKRLTFKKNRGYEK